MNTKEQTLLESTVAPESVRMKVRTRTCIDVGLWWRQKPLWLVITDNMVVIFAISRRKHVEQVPLACCNEIHYNPASGELVISSLPALRFPRLKMPASTALEIIDLIKSTTQTSTADSGSQL